MRNRAVRRPLQFPARKKAALSLTFDDGSQSHMDVVFPMLEEFGFKASFYVIAGLTRERKIDPLAPNRVRPWWAEVSWEEWRAVAAAGHEIGNHSMTHPAGGLPRVRDPARLLVEIRDSADLMRQKLGRKPETFAYPYSKTNARVRSAVLQHHRAAREKRVRYGGRFFSLDRANRIVDRAIQNGQWVVAVIHGVGSGFEPIAPELLRAHLEFLKTRRDELWVDTFARVSEHCSRLEP